MPETHSMVLIRITDDIEEWYCSTCGRHIELFWFPYKKNVLFAGDENACHIGSVGDIISMQVILKNTDNSE